MIHGSDSCILRFRSYGHINLVESKRLNVGHSASQRPQESDALPLGRKKGSIGMLEGELEVVVLIVAIVPSIVRGLAW
jgi:hypothetical protein